MDLALLRALQAMKRVEDDPSREFQTKTFDLATFVPEYPNVVIVDQSVRESLINDDHPFLRSRRPSTADSAEGPVRLELVTNSLTRVWWALSRPSSPLSSLVGGLSIILKEGSFINPMVIFHELPPSSRVEVVGLKDVRLLFTEAMDRKLPVVGVSSTQLRLTLNNVRIYDFRKSAHQTGSIEVRTEARTTLVDVKLHAPNSIALLAVGKGSSTSFKDCSLTGCQQAIYSKGAVEVRMENSLVSEMRDVGVMADLEASFTAIKSRFVNHNMLVAQTKGRLLIERCRFERDPNYPLSNAADPVDGADALRAGNEGNLTCEGSSFRGFDMIVRVQGSNSEAVLKACEITATTAVAEASVNGSLAVTDNDVDSSADLLVIGANVNGTVEFTKNRLSHSTRRVIAIDKVSKKPKHDVDGIVFEPMLYRQSFYCGRTDKERSDFTNSIKNMTQQLGGLNLMDYSDCGKYKRCGKCLKYEDNDAIIKWSCGKSATRSDRFRYCGRCRLATYCSKECQLADWPDHRLLCKIQRSP